MIGRVRIISDGVVQGTKVLMPDGTPVPNVSAVEILPLRSGGGAVQARLTLSLVELDVTAELAEPAEREGVGRLRIERSEPGPELQATGPARLYGAEDTRQLLHDVQRSYVKAADA